MTDDTQQKLNCNFCGKHREEVEKLIAGPNVYICDECIKLSYDIVKEDNNLSFDALDFSSIPKPMEIKSFLDEYIMAQDYAKEILSVNAYNHYKRITNQVKDVELEKTNILLMGSTGTGKTLLAKTLAKKLNVPFAIADATTLTEAGYVGEDVESVLERLLSLADYDIEVAQRGVVFIDEVDKKARKSESNTSTRDVSGEGVQQALLRLIEGTKTKIKVGTGKKFTDEYVEFDTSNVLFILSGAFVGIEAQIEKRLRKNSNMGFNSKLIDTKVREELLESVTPQDVIQFGLIPELVGRLPVIATLEKLNESHLKSILGSIKNNVLSQTEALLKIDNLDIHFEDEYLSNVARLADQSKVGARSLKSFVENSVTSIMFRASELNKKGVIGVRYDKYPAEEIKPILIFNDNREEIDEDYKLYRGIDGI
jgi:ATP-dependent Clp protease ATP-binding subunit ClpX